MRISCPFINNGPRRVHVDNGVRRTVAALVELSSKRIHRNRSGSVHQCLSDHDSNLGCQMERKTTQS